MLPRRGILAGLLLGLVTVAIAGDSYQKSVDKEAVSDIEEFSKMLEQVDQQALHAALHDYSPKKFKHGMFKEDRTAVEAIHREQPSVASTIVAKAKRQDIPSNGTAPASTPADNPSPTTPLPEDPSDTASPPPDSGSTDAGPSASVSAVATPDPISPVLGSTLEGGSATPTVSAGGSPDQTPATATAGNSEGSAEPTSAEGGANPTTTPSSAFTGGSTPSLTAGQVVTTTNAEGITIVSTVGGGYVTLSRSSNGGASSPTTGSVRTTRRASSTSVVLQTTTLPDGSQSTVTAVTVVPGAGDASATPTGEAGAQGGSTEGGSNPALQSGVGPVRLGSLGWEIVCLLGGAVGVAMMM
ncbi:MAG: hypothetical protein LQ339_001501 [Xanthoria mediterranea]|nr:MAG: hypothetical protein LQ339_001501 [Xanthoria mediterranea]